MTLTRVIRPGWLWIDHERVWGWKSCCCWWMSCMNPSKHSQYKIPITGYPLHIGHFRRHGTPKDRHTAEPWEVYGQPPSTVHIFSQRWIYLGHGNSLLPSSTGNVIHWEQTTLKITGLKFWRENHCPTTRNWIANKAKPLTLLSDWLNRAQCSVELAICCCPNSYITHTNTQTLHHSLSTHINQGWWGDFCPNLTNNDQVQAALKRSTSHTPAHSLFHIAVKGI